MTADQALAQLDRALARHGEPVTLSRSGASDLALTAFVRGYQPQELAGNIRQGDMLLICSPSQMTAASWPLPPENGDKIARAGETFNVQGANAIRIGATIVRIELQVRG